MWIMVAGPYSSAGADDAAVALLARGHVPVIGVNMALPMIAAAGPDAYAAIMMPLSLALAERCDACLRIGGPSAGADEEVARFRARGRPVWHAVDEVPPP
jgi:hypothetical protein